MYRNNRKVISPQIAGIVQPNDGNCNLAEIPGSTFGEYEYTKPLDQVRNCSILD